MEILELQGVWEKGETLELWKPGELPGAVAGMGTATLVRILALRLKRTIYLRFLLPWE